MLLKKVLKILLINFMAIKISQLICCCLHLGRYLSQVFDAFVFIRKHSDIFSEKIRVKLLFTLATNTNLTSPPK